MLSNPHVTSLTKTRLDIGEVSAKIACGEGRKGGKGGRYRWEKQPRQKQSVAGERDSRR